MLTMDQIHRIRQLYYEQGLTNLSEIARQTGLDWKTVSKYVDMTDFNEPDPMPKENNLCPKLDPFKPLIDNWLTEDKRPPVNSVTQQKESTADSGRRPKDSIAPTDS